MRSNVCVCMYMSCRLDGQRGRKMDGVVGVRGEMGGRFRARKKKMCVCVMPDIKGDRQTER